MRFTEKFTRRVTLVGATVVTAAMVLAGCASTSTGASGELSTSFDPVPLAEPTVVTVALPALTERMTPVLVADAMGEFAKENITIELTIMPNTETVPALASGQVDVAHLAASVGTLNAIVGGANIRMVSAGGTTPPKDGLWVETSLAEQGAASLKGTDIATPSGLGLVGIVLIADYLATGGLTLDDVNVIMLPQTELPAALASGAVSAAWISSPAWAPFNADGSAQRVAGYAPDEIISGLSFGPNLLVDHPEVGQAFIRAIVRTERTYLSGDYKANPEVSAALQDSLDVTADELNFTDSISYGLGINVDIVTRAQQLWIQIGDLFDGDAPLTADQYLDTSFRDRIVVP